MSEYDDITEALADLGETKRDVGLKLIELDCKGHREEGADCPVFKYLTDIKRIDGIERVVVDEVWINDEPIDLPEQEPAARIPLPAAVHGFVMEFDAGFWPDLEDGGS